MRLISKRAFRDYMEFRDMTNEKLADKAKCSVSSIAFLRSEGKAARDSVGPATAATSTAEPQTLRKAAQVEHGPRPRRESTWSAAATSP